MFKKTILPIAVWGALLSACASQSAYAPAEKPKAAGYTETRLADNRYRVSFTGNSVTPSGTVKDYALLRSAELTLQQGNDWFRVLDRDIDKKVNSYTSAGAGADFPGQTSVYQSCGLLSCQSTVVSSPGFSSGAGIASTSSSTAYSSTLEILMGKNPQPQNVDAYDARDLASNLRERMAQARKN